MEFNNKETERQYLEKISHIQNLINAPVEDKKYLWHDTVDSYAKKIEQVSRVMSDEILTEDENTDTEKLRAELKSFLARCSSPEFQIALVGTIKAGKSTLINAFLNYDLASTRVTPETAALTKFKKAAEDFVQISFYTAEEWAQLWKSATSTTNNVFVKDYKELNADAEKNKWLNCETQRKTCANKDELKNEIERWTSSKSPCHYFVKEVLVGLKDFDLPEGVVLIDTPGLNDVVEFRSNITRNYIKQANAVLMCVKSDSLTGEELKTLYRVFDNTMGKVHKVYVIATQIDTLNDPKKDWQLQQVEWTKYLESEQCYQNKDLVQRNLVPVSAYLYNWLQQYKNNQLDKKEISKLKSLALMRLDIDLAEFDENFKDLEEFTNIKFLYGKLQNEIVAKYKDELIDDITKTYERCQKTIREIIGKKKQDQEKVIADSQKNIDEIRRERDKKIEELKAAQEDKRELSEFVNQLKKETSQRVDELVSAIKGVR